MPIKQKTPPQVKRLAFIGIVILIIVGYMLITKAILHDKLNAVLAGTTPGMITYEDASLNPWTLSVDLQNVKIHAPNGKNILIKEVEVNSLDTKHKIPRYMDIELEGITAHTANMRNPIAAGVLQQLGYRSLTSNIKFNYVYHKQDEFLNIKNMSWNIEHAGKISYHLKLADVKSLPSLMMQLQLAPQSVKITSLSIKYKDESLANRIFKILAQRSGLSVSSFKNHLIQRLQHNLQVAKQNNQKLGKQFNKKLISFIKDPDELKISMKSNKPISIFELQNSNNPNKMLKQLHFQIRDD